MSRKSRDEEIKKRGEALIARAKRQRVNQPNTPQYKPNKMSRHLWIMEDYIQVLIHTEGYSPIQAKRQLIVLLAVIRSALLRGDIVTLPGVGRLYAQYASARPGFGDIHEEYLAIPDSVRVVFKTNPNLRRLLRPHAQYFARFNDNPMHFRTDDTPEDDFNQLEKIIDLENFVVRQGWEDLSGGERPLPLDQTEYKED